MIKDCIRVITPIIAIIGIVVIELKALAMGIDGTLLAIVCAIVGGLGGYESNAIKNLVKKVKNG